METHTTQQRESRLAKRRERYHARREEICEKERKRRGDPAVRAREKAYRNRPDVKTRVQEQQKSYAAINKERLREYHRDYYVANREVLLERARVWAAANPDRVRRNTKRYDNSPKGKDRRTAWLNRNQTRVHIYKSIWYQANKSRIRQKQNARERMRRKEDPVFRLTQNLRARMRLALSRGLRRVERAHSYEDLWGCSPVELVTYLETKFSTGMTWENYGEWHVDHIEQLFKFELTVSAQQRAAFHYTNLRPLWAEDNMARPKS